VTRRSKLLIVVLSLARLIKAIDSPNWKAQRILLGGLALRAAKQKRT
jgi:hypothetical protein